MRINRHTEGAHFLARSYVQAGEKIIATDAYVEEAKKKRVFNQRGILRSVNRQQGADMHFGERPFPPPFERPAPRVVCLSENELFCSKIREGRKLIVEPSHREAVFERPVEPAIDQSMCVPAAEWQTIARPICNEFHSVDMPSLLSGQKPQIDLLGIGGWRMAWKLRQERAGTESVVLKMLKWEGQAFDQQTAAKHQIDAIAMDRLSFSKRVVNIHGFCGHSTYNEKAATDLKKAARGIESLQQRIRYGRDAALAIADLYKVDRPPASDTDDTQPPHFSRITHRDVKPPNFVLTRNGSLKLNDFNDAAIVWRNTTSNGPCMFTRNRWSPYQTSPEEAWERGLTPAVDLYALGCTLFFLITGNRPYHHLKKKQAFLAVVRGTLPELPHPSDNAAVMAKMQRIIHACWSYQPEDRPRARQVATELSNILMDYTTGNATLLVGDDYK